MDKCCLCDEWITGERKSVVLTSKGSEGVNRASIQRKKDLTTVPGDTVHVDCRRDYCKTTSIARDKNSQEPLQEKQHHLRSHRIFEFCNHCLFCGQLAKYEERKKRGFEVYPVRTKDFEDSLIEVCNLRKDEWAETVLGRVASVNDLHAADAVYHQQCSSNFRTGKQLPKSSDIPKEHSSSKYVKVGRPNSSERNEAFLKVVNYLEENSDEPISVKDLVCLMSDFLKQSEEEPYSTRYMKMKLQEHFGERLVMTSLSTKASVVTLRRTAMSVLHEFHRDFKKMSNNTEDEKIQIIKTAAKLIESDVKSIDSVIDLYPSLDTIKSVDSAVDFVPYTLQVLLITMFAGKNFDTKLAAIGQAIMQAIRPRNMLTPLQLGLGIQMHHHFASKFLINTLHKYGFSCAYNEVIQYERNAAVALGKDLPETPQGSHIEFVADNVDHNLSTIDGTGTFHGMGIIATVTPCSRKPSKPIPRGPITTEQIAKIGNINIEFFKIPPSPTPLTYQPLSLTPVEDPTSQLDMLWKTSLLLQTSRPGWSGMMQILHHGEYPGQSDVVFLPMIDLNPSDPSCIYSTLKFVSSQAKKQNVTPILTFDQPLYWKAMTIIHSQPLGSDLKRLVLRLGGFHMQMSFLGAIGHLMADSGLKELLEVVYASNSTQHMLTGKAVSRAVRGHMLVDAALNTILVEKAYNVTTPGTEVNEVGMPYDVQVPATETSIENEPDSIQSVSSTNTDDDQNMDDKQPVMQDGTDDATIQNIPDLTEAKQLYDEVMSLEVPTDEVCEADVLKRVKCKIEDLRNTMTSRRTALLWFQYMDMINILQMFLKAERTGQWQLHLQSVHNMLPYFAASGHSLYAKSAYIYLQTMLRLQESHLDVHKKYLEGYHAVRRSDRFWAGLSSDLVIEQVLMRSIKTDGGLTRGKGITENQRLVWVMSRPACVSTNEAMQKLSGVTYETSEQHKDTSAARQTRDVSDTLKLISYLRERSPFVDRECLVNIANGMTAPAGVNVEKSKEVGEKILSSMVGKSVEAFTFRKAEQAVTLASRTTVKVCGTTVTVDPQLLFQRLVMVRDRYQDVPSLFKYELCSYPPALFEKSCLPLQPNKATLAETLWKALPEEQQKPGRDVQYVLDGGALLHRIPWSKGATFEQICQLYVRHVKQRYGCAVIVFDGYSEQPTTKDATHLRRTEDCQGVTVHFTCDMALNSKKDEFLNNKVNKQRFIYFVSEYLERAGCSVHHAEADADFLIVQTAIASAKTQDTVVVGDDTDLLVLLLYHAEVDAHELFLKPEPKKIAQQTKSWHISQTKESLGPYICDNILFIHAFLGCDVTSRPYGLGKGLAVKGITNAKFRKQADIFNSTEATKDELVKAGEKAFVHLYGGRDEEGLDNLCYRKFCEKLKGTSHVLCQTLPPTFAASVYHSLRVYFQVMQWKGKQKSMNPEDWGWQLVDNKYLPKQTDKAAAPTELLNIIFCGCKTQCDTRRCTCRQHGLFCSDVCTHCRGTSCKNSEPPDLTDN